MPSRPPSDLAANLVPVTGPPVLVDDAAGLRLTRSRPGFVISAVAKCLHECVGVPLKRRFFRLCSPEREHHQISHCAARMLEADLSPSGPFLQLAALMPVRAMQFSQLVDGVVELELKEDKLRTLMRQARQRVSYDPALGWNKAYFTALRQPAARASASEQNHCSLALSSIRVRS